MADVNLLDIAKTMPDGVLRSSVMTYAAATHVTATLPFMTEPSGVTKYEIKNQLPYTSANTRAFGSNFTATKANPDKFSLNVAIAGGRVQMDRALLKINPQRRTSDTMDQIAAFAHVFSINFFEGSGETDFVSIDQFIDNYAMWQGQQIDAGTSSTPAVITQDLLDEALGKHNIVPGSTYIYCTEPVNRKIMKDARGNQSGQLYNIQYSPFQLGFFAGQYNNIPIIVAQDGAGDSYLTVTSNSCSMYIVTYGPQNLMGFQQSPPDSYDLNAISINNAWDYEHMVGIAPKSRKCITRINYVKNALS